MPHECESQTVGAPVKLLLESAMPCRYPDTNSVAAITLFAADGEGVECPTAKNLATLKVEGGTLLSMGNGSPNSHDSDSDATSTFCQN